MLSKLLTLAILWSSAFAGQRTVFQAKTGRVLGEVDDYDLSLLVFLKDIELTPKQTKSLHIAESGKRYEMSLGTSRFGHIQSSLVLVDKEQPNGEPSADSQQICSLEEKPTNFEMLLGNIFPDGKMLLAHAAWKGMSLLLFSDGVLSRIEIKVDQAMNSKHSPEGRYPESIHSVSTYLFENLGTTLASLFGKDISQVNLRSVGLYPVDESTGEVLLICNLGMASFLATLDKPTLSKITIPATFNFNTVKKSDYTNGLLFLMLFNNVIEIRLLVNFELKMLIDGSYFPSGVAASPFKDFEARKSRMVIGASNDDIRCFGDRADCSSLVEKEYPSGSVVEKFSDIDKHGLNLFFVLAENGLYFLNLQSILDQPSNSTAWPFRFSKHFAKLENGQKVVRHMNSLYVSRSAPSETSNLYVVEEYALRDSNPALWELQPEDSVIEFRKAYFASQPILFMSADDEFLFISTSEATKIYRTGVHPEFYESISEYSSSLATSGDTRFTKVYLNNRQFVSQHSSSGYTLFRSPTFEPRLVCSTPQGITGESSYQLNVTVSSCRGLVTKNESPENYRGCRFIETLIVSFSSDSPSNPVVDALAKYSTALLVVSVLLCGFAAFVTISWVIKSKQLKELRAKKSVNDPNGNTPRGIPRINSEQELFTQSPTSPDIHQPVDEESYKSKQFGFPSQRDREQQKTNRHIKKDTSINMGKFSSEEDLGEGLERKESQQNLNQSANQSSLSPEPRQKHPDSARFKEATARKPEEMDLTLSFEDEDAKDNDD